MRPLARLGYPILTFAAIFLLGEGIARLLGYRPANPPPDPTAPTAAAVAAWREHPLLGFAPTGGTSKYGTFSITKLANGRRITHPLETYGDTTTRKKAMWIFGCSFTQGWRLNDDETYPWLLQKELPDWEVVNFGVSAYSTLQSLIQLEDALDRGEQRPELAIMAYADFHEQRNTLTRIWRKSMARSLPHGRVKYPYARLGRNGQLEIFHEPFEYLELPLKHYSALLTALETRYDDFVEFRYRSREVSEAILNEMFTLCRAKGIKFAVAGISRSSWTADVLRWCRERSIPVADISVDLKIPGNSFLPQDGHPNAAANRQYAQKLQAFLCKEWIGALPCVQP